MSGDDLRNAVYVELKGYDWWDTCTSRMFT